MIRFNQSLVRISDGVTLVDQTIKKFLIFNSYDTVYILSDEGIQLFETLEKRRYEHGLSDFYSQS